MARRYSTFVTGLVGWMMYFYSPTASFLGPFPQEGAAALSAPSLGISSDLAPQEIAIIPPGPRLQGRSAGKGPAVRLSFLRELRGTGKIRTARARGPHTGPTASTNLRRDFKAPVAAYEDREVPSRPDDQVVAGSSTVHRDREKPLRTWWRGAWQFNAPYKYDPVADISWPVGRDPVRPFPTTSNLHGSCTGPPSGRWPVARANIDFRLLCSANAGDGGLRETRSARPVLVFKQGTSWCRH